MSNRSSLILAIGWVVGLGLLGLLAGNAALEYREMERTVTVKGLAEHEYPADIVIWPIPFQVVNDDLGQLYRDLDSSRQKVLNLLRASGIPSSEISLTVPQITDKYADGYGKPEDIVFRYSASQSVTVYSTNIERTIIAMGQLGSLGRDGVSITASNYDYYTQYLFSALSNVKPAMIEEATANAREVAQKFAEDSNSKLGKIKSARQGQFSISDRDSNNPHIKKIRVVNTVEYYLAD